MAYQLTCGLIIFTGASLMLKYYGVHAAGAFVGFSCGAVVGALGSAIGHDSTIKSATLNILSFSLVGAICGAVAVECVMVGASGAQFILDRYLQFVTQ